MQITKSAKINAPSDDRQWSACFIENGLWILLEVKTDENTLASHLGKSLLDLVLTKYTSLEVKNLSSIKELLKEAEGNPFVTTLIIGFLADNQMFLGSLGSGICLLKRNGKYGKILSGNATSLGYVEDKDIIFCYSSRFDQALTAEKREELLFLNNIEEIEENIAPKVLENEKVLGCGVLIFSLGQVSGNTMSIGERGLKNIGSRFLQKFPWQKIFQPILKLSNFNRNKEEAKNKRTLLTVAFLLVVILILSIFFNIRQSKLAQKNKKLQESLVLIREQYEEAVSLIDLNPVRARELLASSKMTLGELLAESKKNSREYKNLSDWLNKISSSEVEAYKIFKLTSVPVFFDINLIKPQGEGISISSYKEKKVILDGKNRLLYYLATDSKQSNILAGEDTIEEGKNSAIHGQNAYILNQKGIVSIDLTAKSAEVVVNKDDSWGEIVSLNSFAGNLYLLDRQNSAVWKYISTDLGFSDRKNYLNPGVNIDLSRAQEMIIDGSVWVRTSDEIFKFTNGSSEQFSLKGFSDTITQIDGFYTSDSEKYLYLLDKTLTRIIVFDKDGIYQSQYQWDELKNANDFVVTESEKKIFVLIGSKIYAIDIK